MRRKFIKAAAAVCSLAMLSSTAFSMMSISAEGSQMLGQTTFDDNIGVPWCVQATASAKMDFNVSDGKYNIEIVNPGGKSNDGVDRWDCQFVHRGLDIVKGHSYTISYEITADTAGQYYTFIGNNTKTDEDGLDAGEVWHNHGDAVIESSIDGITKKNIKDFEAWNCVKIRKGETIKFTSTWTAKGSISDARWEFDLGGDGPLTPGGCFPEGTHLSFDNMSLVDNTEAYEAAVPSFTKYQWRDIAVNQLGYLCGHEKHAVYSPSDGAAGIKRKPSEASGTVDYFIKKDGKTVYTGTSAEAVSDKDSGNYTYDIDFSGFNIAGEGYTIQVGDNESYPFAIGKSTDVYDGLLDDSLNFFYLNRSAQPIEEKYISAKRYDSQLEATQKEGIDITDKSKADLARDAGHTSDNAYIQNNWIASYMVDGSNVEKDNGTQDVTGGWYDGGDYNKYVVSGSVSAWTLLNMYERAVADGTQAKFADGTMQIPENSNKIPDILDEVKYEIDYLKKMVVKSGSLEGMAYSKVNDYRWAGYAVVPSEAASDESLYRIVKPPTTESTLKLSAVCAQFARLYKPFDEEYALDCLNTAKTAFSKAEEEPGLLGPYDTESYSECRYVDDDFYWAACELWLSTQDDEYLTKMKDSSHYLECPVLLTDGMKSGIIGTFSSRDTQGCGTLSLAANKKYLSEDMLSAVNNNISEAADKYLDIIKEQGYGLPFGQSLLKLSRFAADPDDSDNPTYIEGYEYGSNSYVLNNAVLLATAYDITGDKQYADGALSAMDYIFGKNAKEISYVTGYGTYHSTFVTSKYWSSQADKSFPVAPSGVLTGGPNSRLNDEYIKGSGYNKAGEFAPQQCYTDNTYACSTNECSVEWNASLAWMADFVESIPDSKVSEGTDDPVIYGDLDNSGDVDMSDLTMLSQKILGDIEFNSKQMKAADVNADGDVNIADLSHLKQFIMKDKVTLGPVK